jgi:hypothetical protein
MTISLEVRQPDAPPNHENFVLCIDRDGSFAPGWFNQEEREWKFGDSRIEQMASWLDIAEALSHWSDSNRQQT